MIKKFIAILLSLTAIVMLSFSFVGCNDNVPIDYSNENIEPTDMAVKIAMYHHNTSTDLIFDENTNEIRLILNPTSLPVNFWVDGVGIKTDPDPSISESDLEANKFLSYNWFYKTTWLNERKDFTLSDKREIIYTNPQGETIHKEVVIDRGEYEITWKIKFVIDDIVRERILKMYLLLPYYS